jgi:hypothetical protein
MSSSPLVVTSGSAFYGTGCSPASSSSRIVTTDDLLRRDIPASISEDKTGYMIAEVKWTDKVGIL